MSMPAISWDDLKDTFAVIFCVFCAIDIFNLYCRYKLKLIPQEKILEDHKTLDLDAIDKEHKTNLPTDVSIRLAGISFLMFGMYAAWGKYYVALMFGFIYCVYVVIWSSRTLVQLAARIKQNGTP
jgi:hypothetical protein